MLKLGNSTDPHLPANRFELTRDSRGRYFAISSDRRSVIAYDSTGHYLTVIGRRGAGPGEFSQSVVSVGSGRGDTLFVLDLGRHVSVFSPSLKFVKRIAVDASPSSAAMLNNGRYVFSSQVRTPARIGYPFHVISRDGSIERSFGEPEAVLPQAPYKPRVIYMSLDEKSIWTLSAHYEVEGWWIDSSKHVRMTITDVPWPLAQPSVIPRVSRGAVLSQRERLVRELNADNVGTARLVLGGVDLAGRVWVNVFVPRNPGGGERDCMVEVIDPVAQSVVLSQRVQMNGLSLLRGSPGLAYSISEDADGIALFDIWRVAIRDSL